MRRSRAARHFWHNSLRMFFGEVPPGYIPIERWAYRISVLACMILCYMVPSRGQQKSVPTVSFTFDFPGSAPDHYVISVSDDGKATYDSDGKLSPESAPGDPFHSDFAVSQGTRTHIFDLAKRAQYFEGQVDAKNKKLAFTGTKTLTYEDAQKSTKATYNYSKMVPVEELTTFFQALSNTLEFGHRLDYYLRYQKLALDEELKKMEELSNSGELREISAVAPVLQKIVDDPAVIKVVRARAQRLVQTAENGNR
jgi:hypothetical protein